MKQQEELADYIKGRWKIIEHVDDFIKAAFAEVIFDEESNMNTISLDHNNQVMLGLTYVANKYLGHKIPIPQGVDFSKAKVHVL
jgi:hypothetical protein